jgi:hypothetical protein
MPAVAATQEVHLAFIGDGDGKAANFLGLYLSRRGYIELA